MTDSQMLVILIYVLLGLMIVAVETVRISHRRSIDAMTFFNFYYVLFFVFAPINVILVGDAVVRQKYAYHTFGAGDETTAISILLAYLLFLFGYLARPSAGRTISALKMQSGEMYSLKNAARIAFVFFVVGIVAMTYTVSQVGGLLTVIQEAASIRSGEFAFESKFVFIRQFNTFVACAFVLYLAVYVGKKANRIPVSAVDRVVLFVMAVGFLYYGLATAGRREFIYPVVIYFLVSSCAGRALGMKAALVIVLACCVGLASTSLAASAFLGMDAFSTYVSDLLELAYLNTVQGIADSYVHFVGMQHADLWQFGFLSDIVEFPLQLVPSRLFDFDRGRGMFGETSLFFLGENLAHSLSGEEPPGLHGYLLVNFGYFGMFLLFFVLGAGYRVVHNVLVPAERADAVGWLIYWLVFIGFLVLFREGVLALVIKQHASWWLAIGLLMLTRTRAKGINARRTHAQRVTSRT